MSQWHCSRDNRTLAPALPSAWWSKGYCMTRVIPFREKLWGDLAALKRTATTEADVWRKRSTTKKKKKKSGIQDSAVEYALLCVLGTVRLPVSCVAGVSTFPVHSPAFFPNLSRFFLCWLWLTHGSCVGPQNKIGHPAGGRFPCRVPAEYKTL